MKFIFALCALAFAGAAYGQSSSADTYIVALNGLTTKCEAAWQAMVDSAPTSLQADMSQYQELGAAADQCKKNAPDDGAIALKAFLASTRNKTMRASAKKVFSAWMTYIPTIHANRAMAIDHRSREYNALQTAINDFKTEVIAQD